MSEQDWMERAQSAEGQIETIRQATTAAIERVKIFKGNFGVREKRDGSIDVDFEKFAEGLGLEGCLQLRQVIDDMYRISGSSAKGDKPHIKLVAGGTGEG